ncbi:MAG TPA: hypothetical protein VIG42_06705, partial [Solirubrobacteraceae bacterium]
ISPYARAGYIDHQQLSHDAYLKFIEDDFLGGRRLNPATDGRPDPRPDVREASTASGNLTNDFDFNQQPLPPLVLPTHPAPGPASIPPGGLPPEGALGSKPEGGAANQALQLVASVAPRQNMRIHHRRVYVTVGCNVACTVHAYGHVSLLSHHRHRRLRGVWMALKAHASARLELSLPPATMAALRRSLAHGHSVTAAVFVEAFDTSERRSYAVKVRLSDR